MNFFHNILAVIEYKQVRQPALERALALYQYAKAHKKNADIKITAVLPVAQENWNITSILAVDKEEYEKSYKEKLSKWLNAYLAINAMGVNIERKVLFSKEVGKEIVSLAKDLCADILIKTADIHGVLDKQSGISPSTVLTTLQGYYGGLYASNFNAYGKLYRVMVQGSPETRMTKESLNSIYVRTPKGMSPVQEFCNVERVYGPTNITRFNLFTSITVTATVADGYSTGEAIKAVEEVAKDMLPTGYTYDYQGLTRQEAQSSNSTALIFVLCFIFIYLILSAQYESYILPLAVVLSVPFGLAGAFLFTQLFGHSNDIYMQISLIMLIGLLAKNAILIVQFALERRETGMAISWSAVLGAAARLRPILMTSLAMVIGLLPMMFASGVGKNGNQTLGAAAVGGMLIGTLCQVLVVPTLFTIFQSLQEKFRPMKFEGDDENPDVATELQQYAKRPVEYELQK